MHTLGGHHHQQKPPQPPYPMHISFFRGAPTILQLTLILAETSVSRCDSLGANRLAPILMEGRPHALGTGEPPSEQPASSCKQKQPPVIYTQHSLISSLSFALILRNLCLEGFCKEIAVLQILGLVSCLLKAARSICSRDVQQTVPRRNSPMHEYLRT